MVLRRTTTAVLARRDRGASTLASRPGLPRHARAGPRRTTATIAGALALAFDEGEELRAERAARRELARRLAQQAAVARLGELALRRAPLEELMDAACRAVADGLEVELAHVLEHRRARGMMRVRAGAGWPEGFVGSEFEMRSFADEAGREQYARGPVVIEDLPNDLDWRARPLREHGVVSSADVLLGRADAPAGAARRAHAAPGARFSEQDLDFLTAVAHVLNGALRGPAHGGARSATTRCTTRSPACPNRALLLERLSDAIARADAEGRSLALFFLDVDHLKVLNDSLGHHAGDELLRAIGPRLRAVLRPDDMIARFGGDEFAVLCEGVGDEAHALRVAERLVRAFAQPFEVRGEPRFCSTSVGVVVSDPDGPRGPGRAALGRRRGALPRQGARPRPPRGLRRRPARPHHRAAADRGRPAPRDRGRRPAVGRLPALLRAARAARSPASRRCCAGTTPSAARSRRPSSSPSPRTPA